MSSASISPIDLANRNTIAQGHPIDWTAPHPKDRYDLVVLGAGPAGFTAAWTAILQGRSVAIVEKNLLGGTCINFGCTPSKALVRAANAVYEAAENEKFGYRLHGAPEVDFAALMERVREMRTASGALLSFEAFRGAGADVFFGKGRFAGPDCIEVDGIRLSFEKALIATGSQPAIPDLPGLADAEYLTNETLFELTNLPSRLVCLGAGAINCELAQAFRRLGSQVDLIGHGNRLLPHEDPEVSDLLTKQLQKEGIRLHIDQTAATVQGEEKKITLSDGSELEYDALLVGTGRKVNVTDIGLEAAGVQFSGHGVLADDRLQTANPSIYASGDVVQPDKFTHAAEAGARMMIANALRGASEKLSDLVVPRCTYTDPEIGHVGITMQEAAERGMQIETFRVDLPQVERARIDGESDGFAALRFSEGRLVGATYIAKHAGESLPVLTLAVMQKMTAADLAAVIFTYPTQAEAIQRAAMAAVQAVNEGTLHHRGEVEVSQQTL